MAFLVLTSGLDNMILVLRAISQTDLNLTVPERMAVGLRQVGVEMTVLLMVEELIAAWLLWFVEITASFLFFLPLFVVILSKPHGRVAKTRCGFCFSPRRPFF